MGFDNTLREDDRDLMFLDWAAEVILRQVEQTYVPESQTIRETLSDQTLDAIVGTQNLKSSNATAGQYLEEEIEVLFKREEVPLEIDLTICRVEINGSQYAVLEVVVQDNLICLTCKKR